MTVQTLRHHAQLNGVVGTVKRTTSRISSTDASPLASDSPGLIAPAIYPEHGSPAMQMLVIALGFLCVVMICLIGWFALR